MTTLKDFAAAVEAACRAVPEAGRFGGKVWIHAAWAVGRFDLSLAEFKARLVECNAARLLNLSRCDLVEAFNPYDVRRSTAEHMGATYNFIRA